MSKIKKPATSKRDIIKDARQALNNNAGLNLNSNELESISSQILDINTMVEDIIELNPKIELVIEIMTSLIKSPNDGESENIVLNNKSNKLPTSIKTNIINVISNHLETEYEFSEKLDSIISESLYTKGAYIELNIPLSFIKGITKNIKNNKNIKAGTENLVVKYEEIYKNDVQDTELNITTSLAPIILKELSNNKAPSKIFNNYFNDMFTEAGVENSVYGDVAVINNTTLDNISNKPIIKKVSPHSIIPICSKSDPAKHYGYFYLVNKDGTEVSNTDINNKTNYLKNIMKDIKTYKGADNNTVNISNIDELKEYVINNKLEDIVKKKLNITEEDLYIGVNDDMLLVLTDNMINKSGIKIIFLPTELVSYYAYKYRSNGTGKGLIERVSTLASIKGILTFVNLLSYIKSSISTTNINIDLDEDDVEYRSTVNKILAEVMKNRQFNLPIKMLKVDDFIEWTHKLGFAVNAKHPDFPDVNISIDEKKNEIEPIDTDLFDTIDKDILTSLYCQPEIIDASYDANFATTVKKNFFLLNKRIKNIQKHYNKLLTKDVNNKLMLDGELIGKVESIITNNLKTIRSFNKKNDTNIDKDVYDKIPDELLVKKLIFDTIINTVANLQKSEIVDDGVYDRFSNFMDNIDSVISSILSSDAISDNQIGNLNENLDDIKNGIKTILIRRYMDENDILPEFNNMFMLDDNGKPNTTITTEYNNYIETVSTIGLEFIKNNDKIKDKINNKLDKINNPPEKDDNIDTGDTTDDNTTDSNNTGYNVDTSNNNDEPNVDDGPSMDDLNTDDGA